MQRRKKKKQARQEQPGFFRQLISLCQKHKLSVKAVLIFCLVSLGLVLSLFLGPLHKYLLEPYTLLVPKTTSFLLMGTEAQASGKSLLSSMGSIQIAWGCNGIEALIPFVAAVLAYPVNYRKKFLGLLLGIAGILLFNQLRILGLFYVNIYFPESLTFSHLVVGQTAVIALEMGLWIWWARKWGFDAKTEKG
jgi:exosortase/archaeosortase family protein